MGLVLLNQALELVDSRQKRLSRPGRKFLDDSGARSVVDTGGLRLVETQLGVADPDDVSVSKGALADQLAVQERLIAAPKIDDPPAAWAEPFRTRICSIDASGPNRSRKRTQKGYSQSRALATRQTLRAPLRAH